MPDSTYNIIINTTVYTPGLHLINEKRVSEIIYVRSAVESSDSKLGFLPGEMDDKLSPYIQPLIDKLEEKLKDFGNLTDKLEKGQSIEYVIETLLGEVEYMDQTPVSFVCDCSKDRMERALISVGKKDLKEMAEEDGQAELVCPFCNDKYIFTKKN
jgi:molecular chaperone Hsp33